MSVAILLDLFVPPPSPPPVGAGGLNVYPLTSKASGRSRLIFDGLLL